MATCRDKAKAVIGRELRMDLLQGEDFRDAIGRQVEGLNPLGGGPPKPTMPPPQTFMPAPCTWPSVSRRSAKVRVETISP